MYKKSKKIKPTRNTFIVVFASKFRSINSHGTWGNTGGDICISSAMCSTTYKKELRFAGKAFDEGWVSGWWRAVARAAENEGWTESVGEDEKVGVHEDITVDTSGNGMLDGVWNFSWDDCGVSNEKIQKLVKLWAFFV